MIQEIPNNVLASYDLLREQLEAEMAQINRQGSAAFARGDYEEAGQLLSQVGELGQLRGQVQALEPSLRRLIKPRAVAVPAAVIKPPHPQPVAGQAPAGPLTPNEAYILPILRALVAAGGSARASAVTASVYAEMAPRLTERDWAPRKSSPKCPAWENNIHWCRNSLRIKVCSNPVRRMGCGKSARRGVNIWQRSLQRGKIPPL